METTIGALEVKDLRAALKFTQEEFAKTIGGSLRSVARWEHNDRIRINEAMAEKLEMLHEVIRAAQRIMDQDEIVEWFDTEIPALGEKKPRDLLNTYEGMNKVHRVLGELEWGIIG